MWERILFSDKSFYISKVSKENLNFDVTDLTYLWSNSLTKEELIRDFKEYNPLLKTNPESVMENIMTFLDSENKNVLREFCINEFTIKLKMQFKKSGFSIFFCFELLQAPPEEFYKKITLPVLLLCEELDHRKKLLCNLLLKKDSEILEYNLEGAAISRKSVITKKFELDLFEEECNTEINKHTRNCSFGNILTTNSFELIFGTVEASASVGKVEDIKIFEEIKKKRIKPSLFKGMIKNQENQECQKIIKNETVNKEVTTKRAKRNKNNLNL